MDKEKLKERLEEIKKNQSYPSAPQMAKNLAQSISNNIASVAAGNPLTVTSESAQQRLAICKQCEFFDEAQDRCKRCGCKMAIKTYLKAEKCPVGKW
jgi:uncharacterized paraquat-inducible protein A